MDDSEFLRRRHLSRGRPRKTEEESGGGLVVQGAKEVDDHQKKQLQMKEKDQSG